MTFLPLIILAICFALGMPVAYAMICCVIPYFIADPYMSANIIIQRMVANTESTSMMAAPFFIIAGAIMNYSGISKRIYDFAGALVGHLVGGLGHVNVIVSAMMGGISGSGLADAAYDCKVLLPQMEAHGYSRAYSGALSAATAVITPIIPPGVSLVMFAVLCEVSVGKTLWKLFREAAWALAIPFGLVLGLRIGIFNATEGAAVIAAYSLFVGKFVYKELKWKDIPAILKESVQGVGPVLMILCASNVLSYYLSWERIPQMLTQSMIVLCHNKYVFLILVNLLMLVVGMFLDSFAAMIIIAPLLAPVATAFGIDLVHFGLMLCLNITIGCITPPFGSYIFVVSSTGRIKTEKLYKELVPFIIVCLVTLALVTFIPWFSMVIPNLIYGA